MVADIPTDLLRAVWEYPFFDTLYGRRTRRFGLGFETAQGPYQYRSSKAPVPLCEEEEALLVAAGIGFSGMALWDQSRPLPYRNSDGRTFPSTSRGRRTALFLTNDRGVYVIDPGAGSADRMREADGPDGKAAALDLYKRHRLTLQQHRLDIPRRVPPLCGHNLWASNMPGSTLFMPICDVTFSLIGLIAQFVDPELERFAAANGRGIIIVDDRHGFRPATEAWIKCGFLDEDNILALTHLERQACYFMFSEPAAICQNIFLATEAIGLGGWMHCGILSREIFEALGFAIVEPQAGAGLPNPAGLDRVFQAYCPPYFESMDAAVDTVLRPQLRERSTPSASDGSRVPYRISSDDHRKGAVGVSEEGIACVVRRCDAGERPGCPLIEALWAE